MTSPRFTDPPLAEMDTIPDESRASDALIGAETTSVGASAPSGAASEGGRDDSSTIPNGTRSPFLIFAQSPAGNLNPFAFAPGEQLAHPHLSSPWWDGQDVIGFSVHLEDHSPKAQHAIWSAYSLQPYYDAVVVGAWGCGFGGRLLPQGMMGCCWPQEQLWQLGGEEY